MGTTVRRQPVNFDIPKSPDYKFLNITNFRGLDVSSNPFELASNTASDCLNVYVDETNTLTTRPRLDKKMDAPLNGRHIATYNLHDGYLIQHDSSMCVYKNNIVTMLESSISLPAEKCTCFEQDDKIYLLDGDRFLVISDNILSEVEGYVPTIASVTSTGERVSIEPLNVLSKKYKEVLAWDDVYLPDVSFDKSVVEVESFWADKTQVLLDAGITVDTEIFVVYSDGSFCAKHNGGVMYYEFDDDYTELKSTLVFQAYGNMSYKYAFANDAKAFAVIKGSTQQYIINEAKGYRLVDGVWEDFFVALTLTDTEELISWSFSKDGKNLLYVKKLTDGSCEARWLSPTAMSVNGVWWFSLSAGYTFLLNTDTGLSSSDLSNAVHTYAFNGESNVCGLIRLTNGTTLQANKEDSSLTKVATTLNDLTVMDYSVDGSTIIYTWGGLWGAYIKNFDWTDSNIVKKEWEKVPTTTPPIYGIEDLQQKALVEVSDQTFMGYALGWSRQGTNKRDVYYLGDITSDDFDGQARGQLGLTLSVTDLTNVHINFSKYIFCSGDALHFYVRSADKISTITIVKQLQEEDEGYIDWLDKRNSLLQSTLMTRFDNNYWFAEGNRYYRSQNNDPTYFPITEYNDLGDSNEAITGFNLANDTTLLAYKSNRVYLIQPFESSLDTREYAVTESKNTVGNTAIGAPIVTTLTEIPLQINYDGIYGLSQLQNVSSTERIADLLSEPINERWLREDDMVIKNAKTLNRLYWTYIILPYSDFTKIYLLDNRTNSWYYWEVPIVVSNAFVKDNVTEFVDVNGVVYYLTTQDIVDKNYDDVIVTKYYDYGKKLIKWYWQSQIMPLGTMNYAKRLVNTTFILTDTDDSDGYGLRYSFRVFRKLASSVPEKEITDKLTLVRSTTRKTNVSKFGFIQLRLDNLTEESRDYEAYENNKLRLVGLGLKYVLLEGLIR